MTTATAATAAPDELGRRERKRERTREEIRQAALALFERQGFAETTIEQITEAADVGRRTFFRYFPTKQSVLFADAEEKVAQLAGAFAAQPRDAHPLRGAIAAIDELIDVMERQRPWHRMVAELARSPGAFDGARSRQLEVRDRARAVLADAMAERLGTDVLADPRPTAWAGAVVASFSAAYDRWISTEHAPAPLRRFFAEALEACTEGWAASGATGPVAAAGRA